MKKTSLTQRPPAWYFTVKLPDNLNVQFFTAWQQKKEICPQYYSPKKTFMEKTYMWTYNVIHSCNNDFHFDCADTLINLFEQKYGETEMVFQLKQLRENKWVSVHGILI